MRKTRKRSKRTEGFYVPRGTCYDDVSMSEITFIAEVKTKSPFGFTAESSWDELFEIAKKRTNKPILAKGIHENDELIANCLNAGADYVLVVGRVPKSFSKENLLIEPRNLQELRSIPKEYKAVWNSRDLSTGAQKTETFPEARFIFSGWLCQASNIRTQKDVNLSADAILVGENMKNFLNWKS